MKNISNVAILSHLLSAIAGGMVTFIVIQSFPGPNANLDGNLSIVGDLLKKELGDQGIAVKTRLKDTVLQINLGSDTDISLEKVAPIIHKETMKLNNNSIDTIQVLSYKYGESTPAWKKTLHI